MESYQKKELTDRIKDISIGTSLLTINELYSEINGKILI